MTYSQRNKKEQKLKTFNTTVTHLKTKITEPIANETNSNLAYKQLQKNNGTSNNFTLNFIYIIYTTIVYL